MSELIPQIYFDYLRGGSPDPLVPIFHHNQMDLRGLAGLASRTLAILSQSRTARAGRSRTFRRVAHLRAPRRNRPRQASLQPLHRRGIARRHFSRRAQISRPPRQARRRSRAGLRIVGEIDRRKTAALRAKGWKPTSSSLFTTNAAPVIRSAPPNSSRKALTDLRRANRLGLIAAGAYAQKRARFERRLARLQRKPNLAARFNSIAH